MPVRQIPVDVPGWMFAVWLGTAAICGVIYWGLVSGLGLPDLVGVALAFLPMVAAPYWGIGYKSRKRPTENK